jgi:hypothetical protein
MRKKNLHASIHTSYSMKEEELHVKKKNSRLLYIKQDLYFTLKWHYTHRCCHIDIFTIDNNDGNDVIPFVIDL